MLHVSTPPFRKRRAGRQRMQFGPPPAASLTLVAAAYDFEEWRIDLTFDRAISIASIVPAAIRVNDGQALGIMLRGTAGASLLNPTIVRLPLVDDGEGFSSQDLLIATASSGIVASNDGGTWAGVADLVLPFP